MEGKEESGSGFVRRVSFCCFLFRIIYKNANEPRDLTIIYIASEEAKRIHDYD